MSEYIYSYDGEIKQGIEAYTRHEQIVRCRDCRHFKPGEEQPLVDWCGYFNDEVTPLGFCAWGERDVEWVTCKCGEDIERHDRIQTCPSCGRRVMA